MAWKYSFPCKYVVYLLQNKLLPQTNSDSKPVMFMLKSDHFMNLASCKHDCVSWTDENKVWSLRQRFSLSLDICNGCVPVLGGKYETCCLVKTCCGCCFNPSMLPLKAIPHGQEWTSCIFRMPRQASNDCIFDSKFNAACYVFFIWMYCNLILTLMPSKYLKYCKISLFKWLLPMSRV